MEIKDLQGKLVAVLGFGQEGRAVTNYLMKKGISPVLFDQKPWEKWGKDEQDEIKKLGLNFIFGPDCFKELSGFNVAFRSPGVRINNINLVGFELKGLKITSQTKWFFEHCPAKIIGITGTKGKGTTSALTYEILKADKRNVFLTGNIGKVSPFELLDNLNQEDFIVYELSSFQLQDMGQSPHVGVVLMVTSEHLDYHRDVTEYIKAKEAIVKHQTANDFGIINIDYENSASIGKFGDGKKLFFSRKQEVKNGCFIKDQQVMYADGNKAPISVVSTKELQLPGQHNLENVCAAVCVAKILNIGNEIIQNAVTNFKGLEHRLELVAEKGGVKYYNDSFSTTPETAIAAIESFSEPEIIILGGSSKNSDFEELGKVISEAKNIKAVILIGQEADKIKHVLKIKPEQILEGAKNMEDIFKQIGSVSAKGDIVLLSPACASFDMFKNYQERGEQFKLQIEKIK